MQAGGNVLIFFLNLKCQKVTKAILFRMAQKIIKTPLCFKHGKKKSQVESVLTVFGGGGWAFLKVYNYVFPESVFLHFKGSCGSLKNVFG